MLGAYFPSMSLQNKDAIKEGMATCTAKIVWKNDAPEMFAKNQYTRGHTWDFDGANLADQIQLL